MMRLRTLLAGVLSTCALAACATDNPTDLGGSLLSSGDLVTFEVILPASSFLVYDTSFSGYAKPNALPYAYVAQQFEDALDAHELLRFSIPPSVVTVRNTSGTLVPDSSPRYFAGQLVVKFDTTLVGGTRPVQLRLFHTAERWDVSATWTNRIDTAGVHVPWATPGGTTGAAIDTATWEAGDSVVFDVDSASLALWRDTANATRGALLVSETNGSRVRVLSSVVHVSAHSTIRTDTVLTADLVPTFRTFLVNPQLATPFSGIRAGGVPAWRAILKLRDDLQGMTFDCPGQAPGSAACDIALDSAHVSVAQLLLKPVRPPAGFSPEDTLVIQASTLAPSTMLPLERSPLGSQLAFSNLLPPRMFLAPADTDVVRLDITRFVRHLTNPDAVTADRLPPYIALLQIPEPSLLGVAEFGSDVRLRIVLTATLERRP